MLTVTDLCKYYGDIKSVDGISFSIAEGEVVGLLGPNGAGKSTTMKLLTGLLQPTSGTILFNGLDMTQEDARLAKAKLGYLPELPPLYLDMTAEEQLAFVCSVKGISREDIPAEIARVCALVSIGDVRGRLMGSLSKGYRQRVGIAQALVGKPSLLILDEPTVGLDPRQIVEIRELISDLSGSLTIIISSHILSEIASVCSRIIIMKQGHVVADGKPGELERAHNDVNGAQLQLTLKGNVDRAVTAIESLVGVASVTRLEGGLPNTVELLLECDSTFAISELSEQVFYAVAAAQCAILVMKPLTLTLEQLFIRLTA